MMIKPKGAQWSDYYFNKLVDLEQAKSLTLPSSTQEVVEYLKIWNRTDANNAATIDIINYEQLIYFEETYKDNHEIQLLIQILKEKIAYNYKLKALLLDNLIDPDLYNTLDTQQSQMGNRVGIWG